tara:strand:- start:323 stop:541 length:219 start_codon:yes stop_codon:yes gene_type:complete
MVHFNKSKKLSGVKTMILYTEKQLQTAYILYVRKLHESNINSSVKIKIPDIEEFRLMYEAEWELYYNDDEVH